MTNDRGKGMSVIFLVASVLAVVAVLPWISAMWTRGSVFGFPVSGFMMLVLAPIILVLIAGTVSHPEAADDGTTES